MRHIIEKYRLFLSWDNIVYKNDITAILIGARFTGPVLSDIVKVADNDSMKLDMSFQHVESTGSWSIARLSWKQVLSQTKERILLGDCLLVSPELVRTDLLSAVDKLLIDTHNHEEDDHKYHLVYPAVMINKENAPYKYVGPRG